MRPSRSRRGMTAPFSVFFPVVALGAALCLASACKTRAFNLASTRSAPPAADTIDPSRAGCRRLVGDAQMQEWARENANAQVVKLAIAGLNDLHGHVEEQLVALGGVDAGEGKQRMVRMGGLRAMAAYFSALCRKYKGNVLLLDAGDAYQGTMVSNMTEGEAIIAAYDSIGIQASTFGNHEFDYGQDALRRILARPRGFQYISANLRDASDKTRLPWGEDALKHLHKSAIFRFGNIKVGVVGMTTLTTPLKTLPDRVKGLLFLPPNAKVGDEAEGIIAAEATRLRKLGANAVVLLGHAGGKCDMAQAPEAGEGACDPQNDELFAYLHAGGAAAVDAAFGGHSHNAQRHFVAGPAGRAHEGVALMQTTGYGRSFSWLEMDVSVGVPTDAPRAARISNVTPRNPVFFCQEHFSGYASCNPKEPEWGKPFPESVFRSASVAATFEGEVLDFDAPSSLAAKAALEPFLAQVKERQEGFVTKLPKRLDHEREAESALGNCYVDAVREIADAKARSLSPARRVDLVIMNSGGIRTGLPEGDVKYEQVYAAFPFDNALVGVDMSAAEVLAFARKIESSPEDLPYVPAPFSLTLTASHKAPRTSSFLDSGRVPPAAKRYVVVTSEFSAQFAEAVLGAREFEKRSFALGLNVRDAFVDRLRQGKLPASCLAPTLGRHDILDP